MNNIFAYLKRAYTFGSLQVLEKGAPNFQARVRFTLAEINAGATLIAAPGVGFKLRMVDAKMIAVGGAVAAATSVNIIATRSTAVQLLAVAVAALTQSALVRAGAANAVILADGASFTTVDENTAITVAKVGSTATTATHVDVIFEYAVDAV